MALTNSSAFGVITGLAGVVLAASSSNCDGINDLNPQAAIDKIIYYRDFLFNLGYFTAAGSLCGLLYNALSGNFIKK